MWGTLGMPEQHEAQCGLDLVVFGGEGLLGLAELPALGLQRLGSGDVAVAAQAHRRPSTAC